MFKISGEAAEIVDSITEKLDKLYAIRKRKDEEDRMLDGKIFALEELRDEIAMTYF